MDIDGVTTAVTNSGDVTTVSYAASDSSTKDASETVSTESSEETTGSGLTDAVDIEGRLGEDSKSSTAINIDDTSDVAVSAATGAETSKRPSATLSSEDESTIGVDETTSYDIWSTTVRSGSTDLTEEKEEVATTNRGISPNALDAIIKKEQTPKKCKRRPKVPACVKATFGCCPDNTTTAEGPFDQGCPVPETCMDTPHGCCADGLSPAHGKNNKDCPKALCTGTLFGCCPDGQTEAQGENNEGCPIITTTEAPTGCVASKFGCCPDGEKEAPGPDNTDCKASTTVSSEEEQTDEGGVTTIEPEGTATEKDCALSTYGCCPDGVSEATGENFHGCSIIDETDCSKSYFGCCSDNKTAARGPNGEGCAMCVHEPFGCCRDNITPAHGPNMEGCCLESRFGCCPDNITPARGPQLEDCGCEYSPHGCCPDNTTAALGHDNEGCGCEHTQFGCCPDKQTPARGPKLAGCPCHTFQFGCCSDGVTIPLGPHNYGCHCSHTEFKCCSDGVTAARGPNFEGCTCATSKHGCCPDGLSISEGHNFEACENVPVSPQKACSLKKDSGNCGDFTVKNFYDVEYGACTRFWYSGCGGNDNRFEHKEDCTRTCEEPEGKAACELPKIHGPCTGYYPSYYYDSERNTCSQFIYGGCLGNTNRFETIEACQKLCVVDSAIRKYNLQGRFGNLFGKM